MIRIKRILCPIDFSDTSRHALDHAVAVAIWYDAHISALHVHRVPPPMIGIGPYVEPITPMPLTDAERDRLAGDVRTFVAPARDAGASIDVLIEEHLNIAHAIVERAASLNADLVAMGTHGSSGFARWVLGSVAEKVLRTAAVPVLTVPPRAADALRPPGDIRRIICPVDFSTSSAAALRYAASLAAAADARLTVVHVVDVGADAPEPPVQELFQYRDRLFEHAGRALKDSITPAIHAMCAVDELVFVGRPYREILRLAHEQQADLIVMGVHGRGALDLMFFGSTTQHVVRQSGCPVLTVRTG
jgi:nucleotide-binding universal stress UspA family protein